MQVCKRASVQILMKCRLHGDICAASRLVSASSQQLTAQVLPGRRTSDQGSMSAPDSPPLGHSQPATCRLGARPLLTPQNIAAVGACSAQSAPQHWLHGTKSAPQAALQALPKRCPTRERSAAPHQPGCSRAPAAPSARLRPKFALIDCFEHWTDQARSQHMSYE